MNLNKLYELINITSIPFVITASGAGIILLLGSSIVAQAGPECGSHVEAAKRARGILGGEPCCVISCGKQMGSCYTCADIGIDIPNSSSSLRQNSQFLGFTNTLQLQQHNPFPGFTNTPQLQQHNSFPGFTSTPQTQQNDLSYPPQINSAPSHQETIPWWQKTNPAPSQQETIPWWSK